MASGSAARFFASMSFLSRRLISVVAASNLIASVALAHPGHDGHEGGGEFSWDFSHLASYPFATLVFAAILGAAVWLIAARSSSRLSAARVRRSSGNR